MPFPWQKQSQSLEELEEEEASLDKQVSIAQKKAVLKRLKGQGLSLKNFGGSFKAALNWLRSHA